jgi:phosphomannomutase/phosphoglucomutase
VETRGGLTAGAQLGAVGIVARRQAHGAERLGRHAQRLVDAIDARLEDVGEAALAVLDMLDRAPDKSMADLNNALPKTWGSPTMSPHCGDDVKYGIVDKVTAHYTARRASGALVAGQKIVDLVTVNGVRMMLEDGTWGLVRASSNKPELVVVVESPVSEANMRAIFEALDAVLKSEPAVGAYNQKL